MSKRAIRSFKFNIKWLKARGSQLVAVLPDSSGLPLLNHSAIKALTVSITSSAFGLAK